MHPGRRTCNEYHRYYRGVEEAIPVLADTADYQNRLPEPAEMRVLETGLHEAAASDNELAGYAEPGTTAVAGDLARATLLVVLVSLVRDRS
jgi:hypothetical protein